ncbi:MAG TPA: ATP-binding protein, partial [Candidatus Hydrogenedens sp.]|nr:ATP-binding protein [Candidatus Hydrogenedens sp.]
QKGEIEGYDEEFHLFIKDCLNLDKITPNIWLDNIHKSDLHLFQNVINQKNIKNIGDRVTIYRTRTKQKNIYNFHITHNLISFSDSDKKDTHHRFVFIYPLCNKYLKDEKRTPQYLPYLFSLTTKTNFGYLLVEKGKILFANDSALELLEIPKDYDRHYIIKDFFPQICLHTDNERLNKILENPFPITTKKGNKKWVKLYINKIKINCGYIFNVFFYDITSIKEVEEQLKIFKYIVDNAGNEFYLLYPDGKFAYVNESASKSLGYDLPTFRQLSVPEIDILYTKEGFKKHFNELKNGYNSPFNTIHRHKDGHLVYKEIKSVYLKVGEGKEYIFGFGQDVTQRKKIEKFLEREHLYARMILDVSKQREKSSNEILFEFFNKAIDLTNCCAITLFSDEVGKNIYETELNERHKFSFYKKNIDKEIKEIIEKIETEYLNNPNIKRVWMSITEDLTIFKSDNTKLSLSIAYIPVKDKNLIRDVIIFFRIDEKFDSEEINQIYFFCNSVGDMVRRVQAEEHLKMREKILESASKCASNLYTSQNWENEINGILKILGEAINVSRTYLFKNRVLKDGTILTDQLYEWVAPGIKPQIDNMELQSFNYERNGYKRWVQLLSNGNPVFGCVKNFPDIEKPALKAQEIVSIAVVPIFVFGQWWGLIGFDDCITERQWSSSELHALKIVAEMIAIAIEKQHKDKLIREQERKIQSIEKLSSLGVMASGIAHEVNNPLTVISLATQHINNYINENEKYSNKDISMLVNKIQKNVTRIENLIKALKIFSRQETKHTLQPSKLEKIIEDALEQIKPRLEMQKIKFTYQNDNKDLYVEAVPTLLTQVIVNILNNSMDAVEQIPQPKISLKIEEMDDNIRIQVEDNGHGIPKDIQDKILDPFFTTKEVGKGTGLGLSLSKSIMDIHGGTLELDNKSKKTCFVINLKKCEAIKNGK